MTAAALAVALYVVPEEQARVIVASTTAKLEAPEAFGATMAVQTGTA